jgi:outer membrane protein assembly factor BamB
MDNDPTRKKARYVSKTETGQLSLEVSFCGGIFGSDSQSPDETHVIVRFMRKVNQYSNDDTWVEVWSRNFGNPLMPGGAWNGVRLVDIHNGRIFIAISNKLMEMDAQTGDTKWEVSTGNTPIFHIFKSPKYDQLIVQNGYYKFEPQNRKGNIAAYTLNGTQSWRCELPSVDDIFVSPPRYDDGLLKANSWNCFSCELDEHTGAIIGRTFTK